MRYYCPEEYGAKADCKTNDATAIQSAIDTASKNGGGTVLLESGKTYFSSYIVMKKNVCLYLQKGAVLKASDKIEDYFRPCEYINDESNMLIGNPVTGKPSFCFIYGYEADNMSIRGEGTIDGNGQAFGVRKSKYYVTGNFYPRPTIIYIEKSDHITFEDITVKGASFWTLHPAGCDDVLISKIRILNDLDFANSDGIDPDHSSNVRILGCHIECADDCICMKTSMGNAEYGPCENIIISDCTLTSTSAAVKIGTEGVGDFRNILVSNCTISKSNRGLSIQIRDGGNVENIRYSNISIETRRFCPDFWGTAEPIVITAFDRDENTKAGHIKDIFFSNIYCDSENGVLIHGTKENRIENVSFENVSLRISKKSKWESGLYDMRPGLGKDIEKHKNAGFFIRYADRIRIEKSSVSWGEITDDFGPDINAEETENLLICDFAGETGNA